MAHIKSSYNLACTAHMQLTKNIQVKVTESSDGLGFVNVQWLISTKKL